MSVKTANAFAQPLRTLFRVGVVGGLSDGQLLDRFATGHREDAEMAFRALMDRHGPMVLRLPSVTGQPARCRGCLPGDVPDPRSSGQLDS